MSIEKVLRSLGEDGADRLADAWHDHEREQRARLDGLALELDKGTGRATLGLTLSGLTLAGLVAASLYVGMELGSLKESTRMLQEGFKDMRSGMESLEERFATTEELVKQIGASIKRIETKQQVQTDNNTRKIAGGGEPSQPVLPKAGTDTAIAGVPPTGGTGVPLAQLLDMTVVDAIGRSLGEVDRIVQGPDGRPQVVVDVGDFLGVGERSVAPPFEELALYNDRQLVIQNLNEAALRALPAFSEHGARDVAQDFTAQVERFQRF